MPAGDQDLLFGGLLQQQVVDAHLLAEGVGRLPDLLDVEHPVHAEPERPRQEPVVGAADLLVEVRQGPAAVHLLDELLLDRRQVLPVGPPLPPAEHDAVVDEDPAHARGLVRPAGPLHHQPQDVDRLGQDLLLRRHLRLEVEDPALPEEEVADHVLDLPAQGLLDHLGRNQPELAQRHPQTGADRLDV